MFGKRYMYSVRGEKIFNSTVGHVRCDIYMCHIGKQVEVTNGRPSCNPIRPVIWKIN